MPASSGQVEYLRKNQMEENRKIVASEKTINKLIKLIGKHGEGTSAIDSDYNYWIGFYHDRNILTAYLDVWQDGDFMEKGRTKVVLTGDHKADVRFAVTKLLNDYNSQIC
jgi:hypothetical protein